MAYIEPYEFDFRKLNANNCVVTDDKEDITQSTVQGKAQVHHSMRCPSDLHPKGKFKINFPGLFSSAINKKYHENSQGAAFHVRFEVYGNYALYRDATYQKIDNLLDAHPDHSAAGLREILYGALQKQYRRTQAEIDEACERVLPVDQEELTEEYFRTICFVLLIDDELAKDAIGTALRKFGDAMKEIYCAGLDKNLKLKAQIFETMGIAKADVKTRPTADFVDNMVKYGKYGDLHPRKGQTDYTKSPTIAAKIFEGQYKDPNKKKSTDLVITATGQILWCAIYDYTRWCRCENARRV